VTSRPRIVAFAYACEPGEGSEPGAGWRWACLLAQRADVTVLTRANNAAAIEAVQLPPHLAFEYVDLPSYLRFWKRGPRGARAYYLLWQIAAVRRARSLHRRSRYDVVWHLTLANAWLGSLACLVPAPFVYGPVGGGIRFPWRFATVVGVRGAAFEAARDIARTAARYGNPLARLAWRRAAIVIAQNEETREWFPRRVRDRAVVIPNAMIDPRGPRAAGAETKTAFFVGRLVPWKGGAVAIRAVARAAGWRLVFYGDGRDRHRLEALARRLAVGNRIGFRGHAPRSEVFRALREEADVCLHPSLREDCGWAVAEAIAIGVPVVALGIGGPAALAPENAVCPDGGIDGVVSALVRTLESGEFKPSVPRGEPSAEVDAILAHVLGNDSPRLAIGRGGVIVGAH
jgi:glycosyltransferase involved in cell wall biosynthesis